jgi:predicted alpha/beta-fold hydrolase
VGPNVTLWQPKHGGHVGFAGGALPPGNAMTMPTSVFGWLKGHNH